MEHSTSGTICPVCQAEIKPDEQVTVCPTCSTAHHTHCWERSGGCAVPSCPQHPQNSTPVCAACGAPLNGDQAFCSKCGAPRQGATPPVCAACGAPLEPGQAFCPKCGQRAGGPVQGAVPPTGRPVTPAAKRSGSPKLIIIIAAVIVVAAAAIYFFTQNGGGDSGPNFQKLYNEYCDSTWAELGDDGSYLYIDTNPDDNEDDGLAYVAAYTAVKNVNSALELPDSLLSDMEETTGADGKQTEEFDDLNLTVSWRYHPDRGLEVTYKKG